MKTKQKKPSEAALQQLHSLLHHLGWNTGNVSEAEALGAGLQWQSAPMPDGSTLLIVLSKLPLESSIESFKSYEDMTRRHRELISMLSASSLRARHVLVLDNVGQMQLLDVTQEEVLLEMRGDSDVREKLSPLFNLNALTKGSLATHSRKTLGQRARELADWTRVWSARIGAATHASREQVRTLFHWMLLARLAEQLGFGPKRRKRFADYGIDARAAEPARYLMQVFKPLSEQWNLLQGNSTDKLRDMIQRAAESGELALCLHSFSRLSASKFSAPVFAEAFSDDELRLLGWRLSILAVEELPRESPADWFAQPMVVSLDENGFPLLLKKFDVVTDDLRRLAREQAVQQERGERAGMQLDAFGSAPAVFGEEQAPRLVLQFVLKVETRLRDRADLARLVLLAHAAEWHARLREAEPIFPIPQITMTEQQGGEKRARPSAQDAWMN